MHARAHEHWRCADALHTTRPTRRVLSRYITCNASGYEGTAAQRPFEGLRRGPPAALWFELICCVGQVRVMLTCALCWRWQRAQQRTWAPQADGAQCRRGGREVTAADAACARPAGCPSPRTCPALAAGVLCVCVCLCVRASVCVRARARNY